MLLHTITRSMKRGGLRHVLHLVILAIGIIGLLPANAGAAVIPADQADPAAVRAANIDAQADRINAGGDVVGTLISIALLVLLVLLILHLLGYIDLRLPRPKPKPAT